MFTDNICRQPQEAQHNGTEAAPPKGAALKPCDLLRFATEMQLERQCHVILLEQAWIEQHKNYRKWPYKLRNWGSWVAVANHLIESVSSLVALCWLLSSCWMFLCQRPSLSLSNILSYISYMDCNIRFIAPSPLVMVQLLAGLFTKRPLVWAMFVPIKHCQIVRRAGGQGHVFVVASQKPRLLESGSPLRRVFVARWQECPL